MSRLPTRRAPRPACRFAASAEGKDSRGVVAKLTMSQTNGGRSMNTRTIALVALIIAVIVLIVLLA